MFCALTFQETQEAELPDAGPGLWVQGYTAGMSNVLKTKRGWFQFSLDAVGDDPGDQHRPWLVCEPPEPAPGGSTRRSKRSRSPAAKWVSTSEYLPDGYHLSNPSPPAPVWLSDVLGMEFFADVTSVYLQRDKATDATMIFLDEFPELRRLSIDNTRITHEGLNHVKGLTRLHKLYVHTAIADTDFEFLESLTSLEELDLGNWRNDHTSQITDTGLAHLAGLTKMEAYSLEHGCHRCRPDSPQKLDRITIVVPCQHAGGRRRIRCTDTDDPP